MATLSFRNVNKVYPNKVQAVFDFNLEIKDKEFIVLVGPSGCGKSTTLRMLAGFEDITEGEIYINDTLVNAMAPKDRDIAMVFQNYALYPHMTVYENMAFSLKLRKVSMPLMQLDDENPEFIEKKAAIKAEIAAETAAGIAELKEQKVDKEKIKEFKFQQNNKLKVALAKLEEEYSVQVMTFDHAKVKELQEALKAAPEEEKEAIRSEIEATIANDCMPAYTTRHYTSDEIAERVTEAAEILGLIPYLRRKPAALSGGQRQRVALGRAIVRQPKVFLMDEPLSNLDAKLRVQTRGEISRIHQRVGATTIYVTHDQTEAMTMASRIVIMKDGYIQQIGTPKEVYANPENIFVAGFIGSPSMNFFTGLFDGKNFVFHDGTKFALGKELVKRLAAYKDREVVMGIRPEDIYLSTDKTVENKSKPLSIPCDLSELLGYESIVYGLVAGEKIVIKTSAKHDIKSGDVLDYVFDEGNLHFFDPESTNVIK